MSYTNIHTALLHWHSSAEDTWGFGSWLSFHHHVKAKNLIWWVRYMKPAVLHKCCFFNQNGTMAYNPPTHTHTHTHIYQVNTTPSTWLLLVCTKQESKIHINIKYTKYRQYFCATPYIPLDFKRVRKIDKSDYLFRNVSLPARNSPHPGRIFTKFDTCVFLKSRSRKFKLHYNLTRITGIFTPRPMYIYISKNSP
jgi:hypothetical protein